MKTRTLGTLGLLAAALLGGLGAMPSETKHPVLDKLTDVGPTAKRQANYLLTEVIHYFEKIDKIIGSDSVVQGNMDDVFTAADNHFAGKWADGINDVLEAYLAWAKQKGQTVKSMPQDWKDYFAGIAAFLTELSNTHGPKAVRWKRELNAMNKRFAKYTKFEPTVLKVVREDAVAADAELAATKALLDKPVVSLDDAKQRRRHLQKAKTTMKNIQEWAVTQVKRVDETMSDTKLKPDAFKKGLDDLEAWSNALNANDKVPPPPKALAAGWVGVGKTKLDEFKRNYGEVERGLSDFRKGDLFKDTAFFKGVRYDGLAAVVEEWLAKADARIDKIEGK